MRYAYEGAAIAVFSGQTFYCKPDQFRLNPITGSPICPLTVLDIIQMVTFHLRDRFIKGITESD